MDDVNGIPAMMRKRDVAELLQCSTRQVELLVKAGRLPEPLRLGEQSPRWRRPEILQTLGLDAGGLQQ